jgi:hypothetical protein
MRYKLSWKKFPPNAAPIFCTAFGNELKIQRFLAAATACPAGLEKWSRCSRNLFPLPGDAFQVVIQRVIYIRTTFAFLFITLSAVSA